MNTSEFIIDAAANSGLTEWGLIKTAALRFYPQIRQICEGNSCRGYGKTWACPPAVGTLEECTNRALQYENMLLFSQKFELEDSFGFIVSELAQQAGIKYNNGPNTVTFFGAVLYN